MEEDLDVVFNNQAGQRGSVHATLLPEGALVRFYRINFFSIIVDRIALDQQISDKIFKSLKTCSYEWTFRKNGSAGNWDIKAKKMTAIGLLCHTLYMGKTLDRLVSNRLRVCIDDQVISRNVEEFHPIWLAAKTG